MRYKALVSFCGRISMTIGEERELSESGDVKSLVKAGYLQKIGKGTEAKKDEIKPDNGGNGDAPRQSGKR